MKRSDERRPYRGLIGTDTTNGRPRRGSGKRRGNGRKKQPRSVPEGRIAAKRGRNGEPEGLYRSRRGKTSMDRAWQKAPDFLSSVQVGTRRASAVHVRGVHVRGRTCLWLPTSASRFVFTGSKDNEGSHLPRGMAGSPMPRKFLHVASAPIRIDSPEQGASRTGHRGYGRCFHSERKSTCAH